MSVSERVVDSVRVSVTYRLSEHKQENHSNQRGRVVNVQQVRLRVQFMQALQHGVECFLQIYLPHLTKMVQTRTVDPSPWQWWLVCWEALSLHRLLGCQYFAQLLHEQLLWFQ